MPLQTIGVALFISNANDPFSQGPIGRANLPASFKDKTAEELKVLFPPTSQHVMLSDLVVPNEVQTLIRRPRVLALTGWSKSTLGNRVADGDFPAPVPTGPRTVAWVESEVAAWVAARISERDARLEKQKAFQVQAAPATRG